VRCGDALEDGEGNDPYTEYGVVELGEIERGPGRVPERGRQEGGVGDQRAGGVSFHTRLQQVTAPSALASSETSTE